MSDTPPSPAIARAHALAALVRGLLERPDDLSGHEALAQAMVAVPIESPIRLVAGPEGLEVDRAPTDVPVLSTFLLSAALEELGISSQVTAETLLSLARLLTSLPEGADQVEIEERFRGLDATTLQVRFRVRAARPTAMLDRVSAMEQLELPAAPSAEIAAVLMQVEAISTIDPPDDELEWEAISRLIPIIGLALKYGRDDELVDGLTALLVFEQGAQRDPRQVARRGAISQAIRKLTTPPLLHQLVSMRMASADLLERAHLLQLILHRFKEDGVRAMFLRWAAAPTVLLRESVMQALKTMPRLHDTLDTVVRGTDELLARSAIAGLAELSDPRAEELLREHSRHPNEKVRRAALTALSRYSSDLALASLVAAVGDDVMIVRLCAVQARG